MTLKSTTFVMGLCFLPAMHAPGQEEGGGREAHGVFTGDMKPVLYVTDVEQSVPFYRDLLGFAFEGFANLDGAPYYAEMVAGDSKFGLHEPTSQGQEARIGMLRLYFRVIDLHAHRSRILARGAAPGDIRTTGWMDMFVVHDPDGNEIVFAATDPGRHSSDPWKKGVPVERDGKYR